MPGTRPKDTQTSRPSPAGASPDPGGAPPSDRRAPRAPAWLRVLPEVLVLAGLLPLWITASQWTSTVGGPGPAFYPRLLLGLLALCLVLRVAQEVKQVRQAAAGAAPVAEAVDADGEGEGPVDLRYALLALGLAALYVWGTLWIGWVIATFLAVVVFLVIAGKRNPLVIVPTALVLSVGMAYVFVKVVYIALPTGTGIFDTVTYGLLRLMGAA